MIDSDPDAEWTLVHGRLTRSIDHAGLRSSKGEVYDVVQNKLSLESDYLRTFDAEVFQIVRREGTGKILLFTDHF